MIEAVGPDVPGVGRFAVGDRVMALTRFGAYATALNVDAARLRAVPPGWTAAQAAAWPVQGLTAWYGVVRLGDVRAGQVVLLQGGGTIGKVVVEP